MTDTHYIFVHPLGDYIIFLSFGVLKWVMVVKWGFIGF